MVSVELKNDAEPSALEQEPQLKERYDKEKKFATLMIWPTAGRSDVGNRLVHAGWRGYSHPKNLLITQPLYC